MLRDFILGGNRERGREEERGRGVLRKKKSSVCACGVGGRRKMEIDIRRRNLKKMLQIIFNTNSLVKVTLKYLSIYLRRDLIGTDSVILGTL